MKLHTVFCVAGAILLNIAGCLGQADGFEFPDILQELESPVVDNTACNAAYETFVTDKHICAEFLDGKGPCAAAWVNQMLSSSVNFTDYIRPVCLAAAGSEFPAGTESWVTGWGSISAEVLQLPDILQEVENPVVDNTECNNSYGGIITDKLICAGFLNEGGKAPCRRDFGSPLLIRQGSVWIEFGVAVFSRGCGLPGYPAVYIRVSEYQDWISNYTSSNEPGFVSYPIVPVIVSVLDGGSVNVLSFSIALTFSIIPLILHFF
ncbi:chymotrypsinogen A-like protein [Labeo rohita]|uniref:Chymotrypsinogen A-like protein n=1 Tax=Labeo rohita TaxID=84645 RepID=A0A498LWC3_LABRO|nr:chymotrypsinogen A-like protein [Labeo rohita]